MCVAQKYMYVLTSCDRTEIIHKYIHIVLSGPRELT